MTTFGRASHGIASNPPSALHQPKGGHRLYTHPTNRRHHNAACCHFNLTSLSEIAGIDARPISAYQKFAFLPCRIFQTAWQKFSITQIHFCLIFPFSGALSKLKAVKCCKNNTILRIFIYFAFLFITCFITLF